MSTLSKVTVMMPARNTEKYIGQAIESIINQTYSNWELIIADDKSTDNTRAIAESYAQHDTRIRVISGEGVTVAHVRNKIIQEATGEYILNMDSDDFSVPHRMETLLSIASQYKNSVICSNVSYTNPNLNIYNSSRLPCSNKGIRAGFKRIFNRLTIIPGTALINTDLLKNVMYNDFYRYLEDWDLILRISEIPDVIFINVAEPLYLYRLNNASVTFSQGPRIECNLLLRYNESLRRRGKKEIKSQEHFKNFLKSNLVYGLFYNTIFLLKRIQHFILLLKRKYLVR